MQSSLTEEERCENKRKKVPQVMLGNQNNQRTEATDRTTAKQAGDKYFFRRNVFVNKRLCLPRKLATEISVVGVLYAQTDPSLPLHPISRRSTNSQSASFTCTCWSTHSLKAAAQGLWNLRASFFSNIFPFRFNENAYSVTCSKC